MSRRSPACTQRRRQRRRLFSYCVQSLFWHRVFNLFQTMSWWPWNSCIMMKVWTAKFITECTSVNISFVLHNVYFFFKWTNIYILTSDEKILVQPSLFFPIFSSFASPMSFTSSVLVQLLKASVIFFWMLSICWQQFYARSTTIVKCLHHASERLLLAVELSITF